jgi:chromosomal replication initiator protein
MNKVAELSVSEPFGLVWGKVASALRAELGDGPYNSYVAPSALRQTRCGELCVVTPTATGRDWVKRNALRRMNELWRREDSAGRRLEVKSKVEFESENGSEARSAAGLSADPPAPAQAGQSAEVFEFRAPAAQPPARSRSAGLQERLTFETFVAGQGNEFAFAMARQVASWADGHFNPVFFHGPYGYGKTHLLNAIAWEAGRLKPDARIVYLTAERFLSTFVRAVMDRDTQSFKDELRGADMLLIDDVHFIGGKPQSQEELFHTLTCLIESGKRVVLSSDRPPSALTEVEARLRSHLASGLVCAVESADRQLRFGIVQRKLEQLARRQPVDLPVKPEIVQFLADRVPGSIRELEGAINTLVAGAGQRLSKLTVEEAQGLMQPNLRGGVERRITVDEIQKVTSEYYGLKQADLLSERRTRAVARPRQVAMWLCKQHTTRSYPDIGRRFGGRDHTTVLHAVRKIEELIGADDKIAADTEALSRKLRG